MQLAGACQDSGQQKVMSTQRIVKIPIMAFATPQKIVTAEEAGQKTIPESGSPMSSCADVHLLLMLPNTSKVVSVTIAMTSFVVLTATAVPGAGFKGALMVRVAALQRKLEKSFGARSVTLSPLAHVAPTVATVANLGRPLMLTVQLMTAGAETGGANEIFL